MESCSTNFMFPDFCWSNYQLLLPSLKNNVCYKVETFFFKLSFSSFHVKLKLVRLLGFLLHLPRKQLVFFGAEANKNLSVTNHNILISVWNDLPSCSSSFFKYQDWTSPDSVSAVTLFKNSPDFLVHRNEWLQFDFCSVPSPDWLWSWRAAAVHPPPPPPPPVWEEEDQSRWFKQHSVEAAGTLNLHKPPQCLSDLLFFFSSGSSSPRIHHFIHFIWIAYFSEHQRQIID